LCGLGEMVPSQVCKELEADSGLVSQLMEIMQETRDFVGGADGVQDGVEGKDAFAVVLRTDNTYGGSELLDIPPLAVLGDQVGDNPMYTEWVVERVKEFCHVVGLSCPGFEEKLWRCSMTLKPIAIPTGW
jgi:hypothetical protein